MTATMKMFDFCMIFKDAGFYLYSKDAFIAEPGIVVEIVSK